MPRSLALLVVLVLAACAGETAASSTGDGKKYVDAILTSYRAGQIRKTFTAKEARCLAEASIDASGVAALRSAKVRAADLETGNPFQTMGTKLPKAVVDKVSTAITDARCVSIASILLRSGVGDDQVFSQVGTAKVRCIFERLGAPERAQRAFADSLLGLARGDTEFNASFRGKAVVTRALRARKVDPALIK